MHPFHIMRPGAARIFAHVFTDGSASQTITPELTIAAHYKSVKLPLRLYFLNLQH